MSVKRVAVLVDGDNVNATHAARILAEGTKLGRVDVFRVYAAANRNSDWLATPGFRLIHAGAGKNASDLLLSIDAMELALTAGIEVFVIATSDGDFTHLVQRLRERGLHALGVGEEKAPAGFRAACSDFAVLRGKTQRTVTAPAAPVAGCTELDRKIHATIAQHSRNGRGMRIADLAPRMHAAHGTRISTYPERSWRAYLQRRPALYELDPRGPDAIVRFRPEGFVQ